MYKFTGFESQQEILEKLQENYALAQRQQTGKLIAVHVDDHAHRTMKPDLLCQNKMSPIKPEFWALLGKDKKKLCKINECFASYEEYQKYKQELLDKEPSASIKLVGMIREADAIAHANQSLSLHWQAPASLHQKPWISEETARQFVNAQNAITQQQTKIIPLPPAEKVERLEIA